MPATDLMDTPSLGAAGFSLAFHSMGELRASAEIILHAWLAQALGECLLGFIVAKPL